GRGIMSYSWTYLKDYLIYMQATAGAEHWKVYSVNVATGETRPLTPPEGVAAYIWAVSPEHPEEIVVGLNDRIPQLHDLYRVNLRTGERELLYENEGLMDLVLDLDYNIRFGITMTPAGALSLARRVDGQWRPFAWVSMDDSLTTYPIALGATRTKRYMLDSRARDTAALPVHDLETGAVQVLCEDPRADVDNAFVHPTELA